ncbi:hypothetical protein OG920_26595 [Streptomyces europaeiscabiei]|uniref:hypothetical protein n=1 Tax=Streptomyces TaxID=1883 RepID=UPI00211B07AA|nr:MULTISPECIES: hypothetical protein [Streptomyces]MDX3633531.1 hypothetical protein [Streptomyces europaeiscabiei]MDX3651170.1 hypothetical protein [Streptomyces europaeiscabiei]WUD34737.1 hypothetical protein OG858_27240 [Streptomyces europaeiscabiei]
MLDTAPLQHRLLDHADHYARWSGLAIGLVVAQELSTLGDVEFEQRVVFCITAFGLCAVAGVLLADALTLRPQEAVRTASLAPRLVRDHVPPRMGPLIALQGVSLVVLLVITASVDPDRVFSAGKVFTLACNGMRVTTGPWPGLYYTLPMFGALAIATPTCVWALRRIAHGPGEEQQRRDRAWAVTGAWGLLVSSQQLYAVLMVSLALTETGCAGVLGVLTFWVFYPLALLNLITVVWSLVTVVAPRAVEDEAAAEGSYDDE